MKIKAFMEKTGFTYPEDDCGLCELHSAFGTQPMECPKCGYEIELADTEMMTVGEGNGPDPDEELRRMPVMRCPNPECDTHIALMPTEIMWNANHDVYYTGGRKYVIGEIDFKHKLLPSIQQYHERILKGEKLEPWNLEVWLQYDVQEIIADYLYKQGLKK